MAAIFLSSPLNFEKQITPINPVKVFWIIIWSYYLRGLKTERRFLEFFTANETDISRADCFNVNA